MATQTQVKDVFRYRTQGSSASRGALQKRFVESFFVINVPTDNPAAVKSLALSKPGVPQIGDQHEVEANAFCVDAKADPQGDGSQCWVYCTFENNTGTALDAPWIINDSSVLSQEQTALFPDTWKALRVFWNNPLTGEKTSDTATITFARPNRAITASGEIRGGRPPNAWFDAVGRVSGTEWQHKKAGFWLCAGVETETRNQGSSYSVKVTFLSRNHIDWSEYGLARDFSTGKFVPVDARIAANMRAQPYKYTGGADDAGGINGGIIRVCPYKTLNFSATFRQIPFQ